MLSRLRHWQVIEKGEIEGGVVYAVAARLRLDPSQMPKTFQVSALSNREWSQSSEWLRWSFSAPEPAGHAENGGVSGASGLRQCGQRIRKMKTLIIVASSLGGILLFLLASASANTALFARHYPGCSARRHCRAGVVRP